MPRLRLHVLAARPRPASILVLTALVTAGFGTPALAGVRSSAHRSLHAARVATPAPTPPGFVGMDANAPMFNSETTLDDANQLSSMVASGVQSIRVAFNWAAAQPYESWDQLPADQRVQFSQAEIRPTDFSQTDEIVGDAAQRGLTVLPTILYAPSWDARNNPGGIDTPKRALPYAQYAAALVGRYGPKGSFWSANPQIPRRPIRMWQIWNEPNLSYDWRQPFAKSYVSLLAAAHKAIKHADPGAKVVLAALTDFAWTSIRQIYKIRGARNLFDIVSINGFSKTPANVMLYMHFMRNALIRDGDGHKPMLATEISWPSSRGTGTPQVFDFDTTPAGQARNIAALLPMIGRQRVALGLIGFYYYTWIGDESRPYTLAWEFSGLLRDVNGDVSAKPALAAFRKGALALERCRQKGSVATRCLQPDR